MKGCTIFFYLFLLKNLTINDTWTIPLSMDTKSTSLYRGLRSDFQFFFDFSRIHTGKCKSTGAGCNELVQSKLRTGVRLKWRKR